ITTVGSVRARFEGDLREAEPAVFLPPREMISAFPGFLASWLKRESSFDRSYYELCVALDARPLRGPRSPARAALLAPLEKAIGGTLDLVNGRFYCHQQNGENLEAPLMAEGLRKLGTLAWLILNGSLMDRGLLCWDEPEANLNPRLVTLVRDTLLALVGEGAQALVATHDYLLASELSLASEYATDEPPRLTRFHALKHGEKGIEVESAALFPALSENAILDAFGAHHDRRRELFLREQGK
ncbi:MAG: ATP-binding protein, partial [Deltaproteobacteria bacterium]|nr:ATP-binding protein [Deltaproteobacteria bacterium]